MSYALATQYAETFHQDPSWFTQPPMAEATAANLMQVALDRGEPVSREEADAAYTQLLGYACPNQPMRILEDGTLEPWEDVPPVADPPGGLRP